MADASSKDLVEAHFIFSGEVQGVGFRATTRSIAHRLKVNGSVRNLSDGTVELHAQGTKELIQRLQEEIEKCFPSSRVASLTYHDISVEEELQ